VAPRREGVCVKLLHCNGRELRVWDLGNLIMRLRSGVYPMKLNGYVIETDDEARARIRALLDAGAVRES